MTALPSTTPPLGPRPRRRPSWAERQRRNSRNPLRQELQNSFGARLLLAAAAAALLLASVNRWEHCRSQGFATGCVLSDQGGIVSVDNVEAFSIVTAAFLFLLERGKRRQQEHLEAMEVVLAVQQAGVRFSLARNQALEQLSASGLWLDGLDLASAQLEELQAPHARWRQINLSNACLRLACLHDADLQGANLQGADLRQADLRHADLRGADLRGANLVGAQLQGVLFDQTTLGSEALPAALTQQL